MSDAIAASRIKALRHRIDREFLEILVPEAGPDLERAEIELTAARLEQLGGRGGSVRAKAEKEIVRLVEKFDTTRDPVAAPWPVSKFMAERDARADRFRGALEACIAAHKTGRYEPMVAAIEAAETVIADLDAGARA